MPDEPRIAADRSRARRREPRPGRDWRARDWKAHALAFMVRCRSRVPDWHADTLGVLASAEAEGVRVLEAALPAIGDPTLRRIFARHIDDERRHARGFADLFSELFPDRPLPRPVRGVSSTNLLDFLAFLEITEVRGEQMIQNYHGLYAAYPAVQSFMATVLRDERHHANYVHVHLEHWAGQGLAGEVAAARRAAARIDARGFRRQVGSFLLGLPRIAAHGLAARRRSSTSEPAPRRGVTSE